MFKSREVSRVYKEAKKIPFNDNSRFVIMSDVHRGDGNWADDYARNQHLCFSALMYYYKRGYTYIENGDGDELWKFRYLKDIVEIHSNVFWLLSKFYKDDRLHFIYGNHDMVKREPNYIKKNMHEYYYERVRRNMPLFPDIEMHEGLILEHEKSGDEIFILHGHQVDYFSNQLWRLARFFVRYLWRPIENYAGAKDPTRAAKNFKIKENIENSLIEWIQQENRMIIAGHTHRPSLADLGEDPYFNAGSCVHPRCITTIEIAEGKIILVKWHVDSRADGSLYIAREGLAGSKKLSDYFSMMKQFKDKI